jgi:formylglycine-generating enzyme required for sulfatase activity
VGECGNDSWEISGRLFEASRPNKQFARFVRAAAYFSLVERRSSNAIGVHVNYFDALAYAKCCGKRPPAEAEWEFAARGGSQGQPYVWGSEEGAKGKWMANTYQRGLLIRI